MSNEEKDNVLKINVPIITNDELKRFDLCKYCCNSLERFIDREV